MCYIWFDNKKILQGGYNMLSRESIEKVLEDYIGRMFVSDLTDKIFDVLNKESHYIQNGHEFFVHFTENNQPKATTISVIPEMLQALLKSEFPENFSDKYIEECLKRLAAFLPDKSVSNNTLVNIPSIKIPKSSDVSYKKLLKYSGKNDKETAFKKLLKEAIKSSIKEFNVPIYAPSIPIDCKKANATNMLLTYESGKIPLTGFSYNQLEEIGAYNGLRLGSLHEYALFIATLMNRGIDYYNHLTVENTYPLFCTDSAQIGCYLNARESKGVERTGSKCFCGVFDLASFRKVLHSCKWRQFYKKY